MSDATDSLQEVEKARTRLKVLADASVEFSRVTTDFSAALDSVTTRVAAEVGDLALVALVAEDGVTVNVASVHHPDAALAGAFQTWVASTPGRVGEGMTGGVCATGQSICLPEADPSVFRDRAEERHRPLVTLINPCGALIVPLRTHDAVIGAIGLFRSSPGRPYTDEDRTLAEDLALRGALVIDNARLYADLERRVRERTAELDAVNKELQTFSYTVSHDLRAPLRAIDGFAQALLEEPGLHLHADGQKWAGRIREAARRMGTLIDDLLSLSRINRSTLHRERVSAGELASSILAELAGREPARRVEVVIGGELPAVADVKLLRILLENLLGNAWKFTSKTDSASIWVTQEATDNGATFVVRDNGAGFDMAYADRLFQPFQRLHAPAEFEGSGIGLATVHRIVALHGGQVWAQGAPGQGATFSFTLAGPG